MKDISLHIIDIFQNSISAKANFIELKIFEKRKEDILTLIITDNGKGMDADTLSLVTDPFFTTRTTRKVGMGIPLLKQNAELTGGTFTIKSEIGIGTQIEANFGYSHIDRQPLGDVAGAVVLTVSSYPNVRFVYTHFINDNLYKFDTDEINEILDGISIQTPEIVFMLKELIENNLEEINVKK